MAINIIYAPPGTIVCPNFIAWGTSDDDVPVTGQMVLPNFQVPGTTIQNPGPGNIWQIQFNGVPVGGPYTLVVWDSDNAGDQCFPISVNPAACNQPQPMPP